MRLRLQILDLGVNRGIYSNKTLLESNLLQVYSALLNSKQAITMISLSKKIEFEAAHRISNYPGPAVKSMDTLTNWSSLFWEKSIRKLTW